MQYRMPSKSKVQGTGVEQADNTGTVNIAVKNGGSVPAVKGKRGA